MLILRDMLESDIENYVRWFTKDTEWMNWDAPWEKIETDEESERESWTALYKDVLLRPENYERYKFEIEADGVHIGWVCAYTDTEYFPNPNEELAIGIDIPERDYRKKGNGAEALRQFIEYLKNHGHKILYTQTWSGNTAMMKLAQKLGFIEVKRVGNHRCVNGENYDAVTFEMIL